MDSWPAHAKSRKKLPRPGQQCDRAHHHVDERLQGNTRDDAVNGIVYAEIDIGRYCIVTHRVDGNANREERHEIEAVSRNSLCQRPLPRYDLNSV